MKLAFEERDYPTASGYRKILRGLAWAAVIVLPVSTVLATHEALQMDRYPGSNMAELPIAIRRDGKVHEKSCLLMIEHYWIWTYGEFMQGVPYRYVEIPLSDLTPARLAECDYAVMTPQRERGFLDRAGEWEPGQWKRLARARRGYVAYHRTRPKPSTSAE